MLTTTTTNRVHKLAAHLRGEGDDANIKGEAQSIMPSPTRSVSEYAADALAMLTKPVKYTVRSNTDSSPFQHNAESVSSQTRSAPLPQRAASIHNIDPHAARVEVGRALVVRTNWGLVFVLLWFGVF